MLKSCVDESSLSVSEADLNKLTDVLFDTADSDQSGSISFDELKTELSKHPGVLENLTVRSVNNSILSSKVLETTSMR